LLLRSTIETCRADDRSETVGRIFNEKASLGDRTPQWNHCLHQRCGRRALRRFPNVDVAVVHTELDDSSSEETVLELKGILGALPVNRSFAAKRCGQGWSGLRHP
jgi:hypothetical protein